MSASRAIILAEDSRSQNLAYHLLRRLGFGIREIEKVALPAGGAANAYVLDNYATQLRAAQGRQAGTLLLVHLDADAETAKQRLSQLESKLQAENLTRDPEVVIHWIPKRNIETWLLWLLGPGAQNEDTDYKYDFEHAQRTNLGGAVKAAALSFYDLSRPNANRPSPCPPSLTLALDNPPPPR